VFSAGPTGTEKNVTSSATDPDVTMGADAALVVLTVEDDIAHVRMNRPKKLNAMNLALVLELQAKVIAALEAGPRALVLTGEGRSFSAGGDLQASHDLVHSPGGQAAAMARTLEAMNDTLMRIDAAPCITVAGVEGPTVGAGMALALTTDIRVMGRSSRFIPGWAAVSATPDGGGSYFLAQQLGPRASRSFLLRGAPMTAEEARGFLLVNEVCDDGDATRRALEVAGEHAGMARASIESTRHLLRAAVSNDLATQLELERQVASDNSTGDHWRDSLGDWSSREKQR